MIASILKKIVIICANIWAFAQLQAPNYEELQRLIIASQDSVIQTQHHIIATLEAAVKAEQQLNSAFIVVVGAVIILSTFLLVDDIWHYGKRIYKTARKRYPP